MWTAVAHPFTLAGERRARVSTLFNLRANTPNIGNALIALGMHGIVQRVFDPDVNLVTLPASGAGGLTGAGLTRRTIYDINQLADGVIVGPGNLLENGGLDLDPHALAALSVPAMLFSVSTGRVFDRRGVLVPRTDSLPADRTRALCAAADTVLVRDRATAQHLAGLGCATVRAVGCPALFLGDALPLMPAADPALADTVLLSIRHPRLMSVPHSVQGRLHQDVRRLIDHFTGLGHDVRLLCHDYQDLPFAQAFPDVPAMYTEDPYRFLAWLRGYRPELVARYEEVYSRDSEASRRYRAWLRERLLPIIAAHGLPAPDAVVEDKFALHGRTEVTPERTPQPTLF